MDTQGLWTLLQPILAGQLRHILTLAAGALIARGAIESDQSGAFVQIGLGIASWAAVAGWSWWQKDGQSRVLAQLAKMHRMAPSTATTGEAAKVAIDAAVIVKILLVAFALSFLVAGSSAMAQGLKLKPLQLGPTDAAAPAPDGKCLIPWDPLKLCGTLTGKPEEDMQRVIKRIQSIGRDDMNYAILKATAANTNGSKVRLQCLNSIMDAKNAAEGTTIKDASGAVIPRPDPAVVTTLEDVAELVDALSPQGPLMTGCAGAAQLLKTNTLAVVNAFVTGAAGIAALPAGL